MPETIVPLENSAHVPPAAARRGLSGRVPVYAVIVRVLFSNTLLAIAGQGFSSAANFLAGLIIIRSTSQAEYGLYYLGFTLTMFLIEQQNALISTPYTVFAPRLDPVGRAVYAGSTLIHQAILGAGVSVAAGLAAVLFALRQAPSGAAPMALSFALFALWIMFRDFSRRVCFAEMHMKTALLCDIAAAAAQIGFLLLLAAAGALTPSRAYAAAGLAAGVVAGVWFGANRSLFSLSKHRAWRDFRENWGFGKWVFASGLIWSLSMNFYPWILTFFQGRAATGVFGACMTVVALGNILVLGVQNFLGPKSAALFAQHGPGALHRFLLRANALLMVPLLALSLFLWLFGDAVIVLLYTQDYAGNAAVLALLGLNLTALAAGATFSRGLFVLERAGVDFAVNFVALLALLTLGLWFVKGYGVLGAAMALLTANMAASCVRGMAFWACVSARREKPAR